MTLYERLKPKYHERLESRRERLPYIVGDVENKLKECKHVTELRIETAVTMGILFHSSFVRVFSWFLDNPKLKREIE